MARTGYVYSKRYFDHDTGPEHPERPDRVRVIHRRVVFSDLIKELQVIEPYPAPLSWIERLHDPAYVERFREACAAGEENLDGEDNIICPASFDIARLAVGGVMAACDAVMTGEVDNAFCAVRPPGHHAERDHAMGFCFFGNVALGAKYLQEHHGLARVAIVDWDAHHGNGTQHLLEADPTVLFISLHEDPGACFPGTGRREERGVGPGEGFTLNFPFPPHSRARDYLDVMEDEVLPALMAFRPECLMISAGFDAHAHDPLTHLHFSQRGYMILGAILTSFAQEFCGSRIISVLEGGYNLEVLEDCVFDHLRALKSL